MNRKDGLGYNFPLSNQKTLQNQKNLFRNSLLFLKYFINNIRPIGNIILNENAVKKRKEAAAFWKTCRKSGIFFQTNARIF